MGLWVDSFSYRGKLAKIITDFGSSGWTFRSNLLWPDFVKVIGQTSGSMLVEP